MQYAAYRFRPFPVEKPAHAASRRRSPRDRVLGPGAAFLAGAGMPSRRRSPTSPYPLGEVVVSAEEPVSEASATLRRVSAEDIEAYGARTLDEAIALLPGVYVRLGGDGVPRVDLRGFRDPPGDAAAGRRPAQCDSGRPVRSHAGTGRADRGDQADERPGIGALWLRRPRRGDQHRHPAAARPGPRHPRAASGGTATGGSAGSPAGGGAGPVRVFGSASGASVDDSAVVRRLADAGRAGGGAAARQRPRPTQRVRAGRLAARRPRVRPVSRCRRRTATPACRRA